MKIKKQIRSKIIDLSNIFFYVFFFYLIVIISIPYSISFKKQNLIDKKMYLLNNSENFKLNIQERLIKKTALDIRYQELSNYSETKAVIKVVITNEGQIIGYKPVKLQLINYPLEKQLTNLLRKNLLLYKIDKSIYWLDLTNKY